MREVYFSKDSNRDIAYTIIAEQAYVFDVLDKDNVNNLTEEEILIIDLVRKDSLTLDELIIKTNLNINDLMVILTKLELDGMITQTSGEKYISLV